MGIENVDQGQSFYYGGYDETPEADRKRTEGTDGGDNVNFYQKQTDPSGGTEAPDPAKPDPKEPNGPVSDGDMDELDQDLSGTGDEPTLEELRKQYEAKLQEMPPEEREQWAKLLMLIDGHFSLADGVSRDLQSFLVLLMALLLVLAEASIEMRKTQRDASFASMQLSVQHLVNQADKMKHGAAVKMGTAIAGSALSILGSMYSLRGIEKARVQNAALPRQEQESMQTIVQQFQMKFQIFNNSAELIKNPGEFKAALENADGQIEQSKSQEDSYDSEQFKDTGNTTRELISSALSNIREFINAYRQALDRTAGNIA